MFYASSQCCHDHEFGLMEVFAQVWPVSLVLEILIMFVVDSGTRSCANSCRREWTWKTHEEFGRCFKSNS